MLWVSENALFPTGCTITVIQTPYFHSRTASRGFLTMTWGFHAQGHLLAWNITWHLGT